MTKQECRTKTISAINKDMITPPEVCQECKIPGDNPPHCHHRDYNNPFDLLLWLCRKCHMALHGKLRKAGLCIPFDESKENGKYLSLKLDDNTHLALKHMAVDEKTTVKALITEGIELLFAMRSGKGAGFAAGGPVDSKTGLKGKVILKGNIDSVLEEVKGRGLVQGKGEEFIIHLEEK